MKGSGRRLVIYLDERLCKIALQMKEQSEDVGLPFAIMFVVQGNQVPLKADMNI